MGQLQVRHKKLPKTPSFGDEWITDEKPTSRS
jgi:hypothetical protein